MFTTIILTILATAGLILQFRYEELKDSSLKKRLGLIATAISIILLIVNNINQAADSNSLQQRISKLDSSNISLINKLEVVDVKQDSLKRNYDSLLRSYMFSQMMLNEANGRIESLISATEKGFKENKNAINDIERITVKNSRIISTLDEEKLIKILSTGRGATIEFGTINTSDEAILLSGQLQNIFAKAGWIVKDERWLAPNPRYKGIFLFANKNKQHKYTPLVFQSIQTLNFEFQAIDAPNFDESRLKLVVGFKE